MQGERRLPNPRLGAVAELVRQGAVFADIGTDHAYLPVFLVEEGRVARAFAGDIAKGPLARAEETVKAAGLWGKITLLLTSGLRGMEDLGLTDIAICGMGGETVAEILAESPFVQREGIRLILQPMTKEDVLRRYLGENGFAVCRECFVCEEERVYTVILAEYTGRPYRLSEVEAHMGKWGFENPTPGFYCRVEKELIKTKKRLAGLLLSRSPDAGEICRLKELTAALEEWRNAYDKK